MGWLLAQGKRVTERHPGLTRHSSNHFADTVGASPGEHHAALGIGVTTKYADKASEIVGRNMGAKIFFQPRISRIDTNPIMATRGT
jgi:hypothetical protein